jgi:hypothetical protein
VIYSEDNTVRVYELMTLDRYDSNGARVVHEQMTVMLRSQALGRRQSQNAGGFPPGTYYRAKRYERGRGWRISPWRSSKAERDDMGAKFVRYGGRCMLARNRPLSLKTGQYPRAGVQGRQRTRRRGGSGDGRRRGVLMPASRQK